MSRPVVSLPAPAITAVYELRQMAPTLAADAERQGALLVCRGELEQGEGVRQRLFDARNQSHWPRLIITDANRADDQVQSGREESGDSVRTLLASRLRFLYIGQRARAESVVQQRFVSGPRRGR